MALPSSLHEAVLLVKQVATRLPTGPSSNPSWTLGRTQVVRGRVKCPPQCPRRDRLQSEPPRQWPGHPHVLLQAGREGVEVVTPTPGGAAPRGWRGGHRRELGLEGHGPGRQRPSPAGQLCPGKNAHIPELPPTRSPNSFRWVYLFFPFLVTR